MPSIPRPTRPGPRSAVLLVAAALVLGAALVTAQDVAGRMNDAASAEAARSAETIVRGTVDPLLTDSTMTQPGGAQGTEIDRLLENLVRPGGLVRIKIWAPDGTVVYSDLPALRGQKFDVDEDLQAALDGAVASDLKRGESDSAENVFDHGLADDLLEVYLPITGADGTVVGAYEIYEDAAPIVARVDATRGAVFLIAGLTATGLMFLLLFAFAGTSRLLTLQNRQLLELTTDLRRREARFRSLVQNSSDAFAVLDADGTIRYESVAVERVLGRPPVEGGERTFEADVHPDDRPHVARAMAYVATSPHAERRFECRAGHTDGTWRTLEVVAKNLLDDPAVDGIVVNHRDVTERKVLEDQLIQQAFHDPLTRLANRALFGDRVAHALRRRRRQRRGVAVLFVDLDDFKTINDGLGHGAGDEVLQEVAMRLRSTLRPGDTVARLGGDEFAFLLEDISDVDDARRVAERVTDALSPPITVERSELTVKASIGIALADDDDVAASDLLRDADAAMYTAKRRSRGGYEVFEPAMHAAAVTRLELEADLRRAIERSEFVLYYQPIVQLGSGAVTGFEALIRWIHPTRGFLPPADFIPVAEQTGLIVPIGRWVLEQACEQARVWAAMSRGRSGVTVSVNLSPRELRETTLVAGVGEILRRTGCDPASIVLEITETSMVEDAESTLGTLHALKALGVRLAIDDFGTGYSSLSYLRRLPVDILKIDRSFVSAAGSGERELALVDAVFRLGRTLGLETIVEGVEDPEQRDRLVRLGCELGQGFLFARPMDGSLATDLLLEGPSGRTTGTDGGRAVA